MKDETLAAKTARLGCATLVDAIGRVHSHRVHIPSMASPDPSRTLFGRAGTISFMPYREDLVEPGRDFAYFFYGALGGRAPTPGQVLVSPAGVTPMCRTAGEPNFPEETATDSPASWPTAGCGTSTSCAVTVSPRGAEERPSPGAATR